MGSNSGPDLRVLVVLDGDTIVVTMPGTSYSVTYHKLHDSPLLVASDMRDDPDSPINKFTFRARARIAANDKAKNSAG
jgi:hypothetical protein